MTQLIENAGGAEIVSCGEGMLARLVSYDRPQEYHDRDEGDDWLKFHFQLRGSARYAVAGHSDLIVDGAASVFSFHGKGFTKSIHLAAKPGFAVTIMCRPETLIERLGLRPENLPVTVRNYLDHGDSSWFAEVGKLTPEMMMSLRALENMPFEGMMRRAYVEARSVELLCDLWNQVGRCEPPPHASIDERTLTKVERTRVSIDEGFAEPLVMRRLARDAGTNETKLSRAFRTIYGMTIFEYVRSRRMVEAQRLLRAGNLSVTEIAFEVGYEYSCNFSVAYKRHFGVTPKEERAATRQ